MPFNEIPDTPLLPGLEENLGTDVSLSPLQAQAEFFGNEVAPAYSILDAKAALLSNKKSDKVLKLQNKTDNLLQKFKDTTLESIDSPRKAELRRQQEAKREREKTALVSDEFADTFVGGAINTGASLFAGAATAVGTTVTAGSELFNALEGLGMTQADIAMFKEIKGKQSIGQELTSEEQAFISVGSNGEGTTSKFEKLTNIEDRQVFIDSVKFGIEAVGKYVNSKKQEKAFDKLGRTSTTAANKFGNGDILGGISTFLGGVVDLAIEDPAAAVELTANSLPQMYVLAKNATLGISTLTTDSYGTAIKEFRAEYKREPDDTEKAIAGILSLVAAGADAIGAKLTINGSLLVKSITNIEKKAGISVAKETLNKADAVVKNIGKDTLKKALGLGGKAAKIAATNRVSKAVVSEGVTEGAQNFLNQLAAKQDLSKISGAEILTDATVGAVAGAHIAAPASSAKGIEDTANTVRKGANKAAKIIVSKATKSGIGKTEDVVAAAKETGNQQGVIDELITVDYSAFNNDQRVDHITELGTAIDAYVESNVGKERTEDEVKEFDAAVANYENILDKAIDEQNKAFNSASDTDTTIAIKTLSTADVIEETGKESVKTIVANTTTGTTLPAAKANRLLGSDSTFKKFATPAQIKALENYAEFKQKYEQLQTLVEKSKEPGKDTGKVNAEVLHGADGYTGLTQHLSNLTKAIALGKQDDAQQTITALLAFGKQHAAKLKRGYKPKGAINYEPHRGKTLENITLEVDAIRETYKQALRLYKNKFGTITKEDSTKPKAEPKVEVKPEIDKEAEYKELVQDLKLVTIKETIEDEDGDLQDREYNAGLVLSNVDKRLAGLQEIWEACGHG